MENSLSRNKSPQEERKVITGQPNKRPYGVKVRIHLKTSAALGNIEEVCISLTTGAFLTIAPISAAPWEGGKKYLVKMEGFPTAASAEASGRRLVQALLWMAVSTDVSLRLEYLSYEPAAVFERNRPSGISLTGYGSVSYAPALVLGEIQDAFAQLPEPDENLMLSMEVFCSARLESSQRTIFLTLVSALEPLAKEAVLGEKINNFVSECVLKLRQTEDLPIELRASIEGRLHQLKKESIRQALKRLAIEILPDQLDAGKVIDDAYALRSQIIHSGVPSDLDIDLEQESQLISRLIRDIYAKLLQKKLARKV